MGGSPGCLHTAKSERHQQQHHHVDLVRPSAVIQSFNQATQSTALLVEEFGNREAVLSLKGNIFGSFPLGNCGYRREGMFKFLTAIITLGYLACFHWLFRFNAFRMVFTGDEGLSHGAALGKYKPDLSLLFNAVCCGT